MPSWGEGPSISAGGMRSSLPRHKFGFGGHRYLQLTTVHPIPPSEATAFPRGPLFRGDDGAAVEMGAFAASEGTGCDDGDDDAPPLALHR